MMLSIIIQPYTVNALSDKQRNLLNSGIYYYDIDACTINEGGDKSESSEVISGTTQELAKKVLENANIDIANGRVVKEDLEEAANGKPSADGAVLNPAILSALLEIAKNHKLSISSITGNGSGHSSGSKHYTGNAVYIQSLDGKATNGSDQLAQTIVTIAGKVLPKGTSFGLGSNKNAINLPDGMTSFSDAPNHVHIQVPDGTGGTTEGDEDVTSSLYMVGDSISVGASADLEREFKSRGINAYINGSVSRSITGKGTTAGSKTSGLEAVEQDKKRIETADYVVVQLGTNQNNNFEKTIQDLIKKVKSYNNEVTIYWVDVFSKGSVDGDKINSSIRKLSDSEGYSVIKTADKSIQLSGDSVHPTKDGAKTFAEAVATGVKQINSEGTSKKLSDGCTCGGQSDGTETTTLTGSDNAEKVWNYFIGKGLRPPQVAGIMGNMSQESNFNPTIAQTGGEVKDPSGFGTGVGVGKAWGLIQWDAGGRAIGYAKAAGVKTPIHELRTQLDIVWWHMTDGTTPTGAKFDMGKYKKITDYKEATAFWEKTVEGAGTPVMENRWKAAQESLTKFGSSSSAGSGSSSGSVACETSASDGSGEVTGEYGLPLQKKWYERQKDWFTKAHHTYPASDIPVPVGTSVYSMTDGKVVKAPVGGACGLGVLIVSSSGAEYIYCHGTDGGTVSGAKQGDKVKPGQRIMTSGNTGRSSGPHLHVQIKSGGQLRCPQSLFVGIAEGKPKAESTLPTSGCVN